MMPLSTEPIEWSDEITIYGGLHGTEITES
jgi:hypothetical protein